MPKKLILIIALLLFLATASLVLSEVLIEAKNGDWIEYGVTLIETPAEKHDATWVKMEVDAVWGTQINLKIAVKFSDSALENQIVILNLDNS
jgi:hypothetical protein